ncbi:MAG: SafA/ExsA family spore coat assembly protein [Clostridiales bacterium]|nr:SafA/ExsA family spore coat assembly protein [Clostridiales bacterium]
MKSRKVFIYGTRLLVIFFAVCILGSVSPSAEAAVVKHTVVKGESMWKIAVKYQVGLSEIIAANDQIKNPDLIYPGQILNIPLPDTTLTSYVNEVIRLTNLKRTQNGLKPLTAYWELNRVAQYKAQDMRNKNYFSHTSPTYGSPFDMIKAFGISYRSAGENIAKGQSTPAQVVEAWWNSSGHRANILNSSYTHIGVGYVADGKYWVQMFIGR